MAANKLIPNPHYSLDFYFPKSFRKACLSATARLIHVVEFRIIHELFEIRTLSLEQPIDNPYNRLRHICAWIGCLEMHAHHHFWASDAYPERPAGALAVSGQPLMRFQMVEVPADMAFKAAARRPMRTGTCTSRFALSRVDGTRMDIKSNTEGRQ